MDTLTGLVVTGVVVFVVVTLVGAGPEGRRYLWRWMRGKV